jgi:hypothetical protein
MSVVIEPETDLHQLTQEIVRVTGIIRVNYPALHTTLCSDPYFVSYRTELLQDDEHQTYLEFLAKALDVHRSLVRHN